MSLRGAVMVGLGIILGSGGCCSTCARGASGAGPGQPAGAESAEPEASSAAVGGADCTGETADSELPCQLPDKRWGWCKHGGCKDVCPAGYSYSHLDTACHKPCSASCKNCMDDACLDDATTRPMLEN